MVRSSILAHGGPRWRRIVRSIPVIAISAAAVVATANGVAIAAPRHIVIVVMENHSASEILHDPAARFLNSFARHGRLFTNYHEGDATGPSLPDYLQLVAGSSCGKTTDDVRAADPTISRHCRTTLWNQLQKKNVSWGVYLDGMPGACSSDVTYDDSALDTPYAMKHNPAVPFGSIWHSRTMCRRHVLPFTRFSAASMRTVSFVVPGICNDQHGVDVSEGFTHCISGTNALVRRGDNWLSKKVPPMLRHGATVFINYDESGTLYAAERGPGINGGTRDGRRFTHYSWLAAVERAFGLRLLRNARSARPLPI